MLQPELRATRLERSAQKISSFITFISILGEFHCTCSETGKKSCCHVRGAFRARPLFALGNCIPASLTRERKEALDAWLPIAKAFQGRSMLRWLVSAAPKLERAPHLAIEHGKNVQTVAGRFGITGSRLETLESLSATCSTAKSSKDVERSPPSDSGAAGKRREALHCLAAIPIEQYGNKAAIPEGGGSDLFRVFLT